MADLPDKSANRPRVAATTGITLSDEGSRRERAEPPNCTVFWCRLPVDTGMRNKVICVGLPKWARMPSMVAGSMVA
jgi:hypothetical protein